MREGKNPAEKWYVFQGGRESRKGCHNREQLGKVYPNRCDQSYSRAIIRGKGR